MTEMDQNWYAPEIATFGDRLTAAREAAGMTQESLSKRLGVKKSTLRSWEEDLSEPRANRLSMLAGLLNVSMMWLINGEGEGIENPDAETIPADLTEIILEIREMRAELHGKAEKLAVMEKRLRNLMVAPQS
ncbi:helix-turn-helix domain-containing protein [Marivita sp.]|uniref:helix-turn-helix domain-containing protein n=1 Tax=Marivita sp. TaxID=2003365 RepID=UPI0025C5637C|nr:helix-turn-helix domain-containing protein [Marivita sp.]